MLQFPSASVETKASWAVASVALITLGMSFGAAWITAVALKDIANEVGGSRSVPALASSLAWLGTGAGGVIMSRIADRVGTRWTVIFGSLMIGLGLSISTFGPPWPLWIGHGLFIGLIGIGGIGMNVGIHLLKGKPVVASFLQNLDEIVGDRITTLISGMNDQLLPALHPLPREVKQMAKICLKGSRDAASIVSRVD